MGTLAAAFAVGAHPGGAVLIRTAADRAHALVKPVGHDLLDVGSYRG